MFAEQKKGSNVRAAETSWKVQELVNRGDTLKLGVAILRGRQPNHFTKLTSQYVINNAVSFQMRLDGGLISSRFAFGLNIEDISLFCKFGRLATSGSDITYCARVSCNGKYKSFYIHDDTWRLLVDNQSILLNFDITIVVSLLSQILRPFSLLYDDTESTDLKLIGEDGTLELHGALVAAHSPVFKDDICEKARVTPRRPYELAVPHIRLSTLQHLKDYIYLREIPDSPLSSLKELLQFASKYKMKELGQICTQKLVTRANAYNFYELTDFAQSNNLGELFLNILELIEHGVIKTEDVKNSLYQCG